MAAGRTETIKRDLGLIFLGDWHPVLRDPLDLFRLSFVVGAGIFALQGDWDAAVRLLFPALAVLAVRALNIPRPIDWIFNIAMFFQGRGNALHVLETLVRYRRRRRARAHWRDTGDVMQACDRHPRHQPCRKERDEAFLLDDRMQLREPAAPQHPCLKRDTSTDRASVKAARPPSTASPTAIATPPAAPKASPLAAARSVPENIAGVRSVQAARATIGAAETQFENHGAQLGRRVREEQCPCGKGESDDHDQAGQTP